MSVKEPLTRALKNLFNSVDVDGSGTLDVKEMVTWADKIKNLFYPNGSPKWKQRQADFVAQWNQGTSVGAQDQDGDKVINFDEFVDGMVVNIDLGEYGNSEEEIVDRIYRYCTYGLKSTAEMRAEAKKIWKEASKHSDYVDSLKSLFGCIDLDKDGQLSPSEISIWKAKLDKAMAPDPSSEERKHLDMRFNQIMSNLVNGVDVDGDGLVDLVDFVGSFMHSYQHSDGPLKGKSEADIIKSLAKYNVGGVIINGQPIKARTFQGWEDARVNKCNEDGTYDVTFQKGTHGTNWRGSNCKTLYQAGEVELS